MRGHRGCRLGVTNPEIYEMQARAIFEAACDVAAKSGEVPIPEVMIPLVATKRELELMKAIVDKEAKAVLPIMEAALELLQDGKPARMLDVADAEEAKMLKGLNWLTSKPVLYVCNVDEGSAAEGNALSQKVAEKAAAEGAVSVVISAAIEAEISQLDNEEQEEFLETIGLEEPGLDRMIRAGYDLLGLITYFTAGPKETRAWTITEGTKSPGAAGVIHTDFERGFIRAQTIAYDDYTSLGGESAAKEAGKARDEGQDYTVKEGVYPPFKVTSYTPLGSKRFKRPGTSRTPRYMTTLRHSSSHSGKHVHGPG